MPTFVELADRLLRFEGCDLGDGVDETEITEAERVLGVRIDGGYRQFLKRFGWGGVGHVELYGLGSNVPAHLNVVDITLSEREEMGPKLRPNLVPVMNDGGGNLYCIDTNAEGEPSVVFWDHTAGTDQEPDLDADDFASWLDEQLEDLAG